MPCYYPITAWPSLYVNKKTGKRSMVFNRKEGLPHGETQLPCGRCIGCRLEKARQWAIRCIHEASTHDQNCFVTLTYAPEHLPDDGSLHVEHFQKFMKRLRKFLDSSECKKKFPQLYQKKIRFFHCGEYGENLGRPHYHAILFGIDFPDKWFWRKSDSGHDIYRSDTLEKLWPFGFSEIGSVTFESAGYVARYVLKKRNGDQANHWYNEIDYSTGEIIKEKKPEYTTMSRRPGIGRGWFEKYGQEKFAYDFIIANGVKQKIPRYYDSIFEKIDKNRYDEIKLQRRINAKLSLDNTYDRMLTRYQILNEKTKLLTRSFDNNQFSYQVQNHWRKLLKKE